MPELTPTGAVDVVERQVRRVRRRKNLYELQRAVYLAIVAAGVAAIFLLPAALFARAEVFAVAAWGTLAALVAIGAMLVRRAARRWLSRRETIAWVEREGALAGRVRTLLELGPEPGLATGFFHPLLLSEVGATLPKWTPPRLVPRRVPRGALAAALVVLLGLAAVVRLASFVTPSAPAPGGGRTDAVGERTTRASEPTVDDRVVVAPGAPMRDAERASASGTSARGSSRLAQLSSALQENVREQVWGKAWERVRDALARAGAGSAASLDDEDALDEAEVDAESEDTRLAEGARRSGKRGGARGGEGDADERSDGDGNEDPSRSAGGDDHSEGGDGTSGAGTGTSPGDLFTGPSVDTSDTDASFELSLAARMRNDKAGRRQAGGAAPEADPDARPALAADQRRETAAHRMTIPAAYEQVVREVFAHREEP